MKKHITSNTELVNWIQYLENKYPVETWKVGDIHIWPLIKIRIFLKLFKYVYVENGTRTPSSNKRSLFKNQIFKEFKKVILSFLFFLKIVSFKLPKAKHLFFGASAHRVIWEDRLYNRFLDPILDNQNNSLQDGLLFDYSWSDDTPKLPVHKSSRVVPIYKATLFINLVGRLLYTLKKARTNLTGYDTFLDEMGNSNFPSLRDDVSIRYLQRRYASDYIFMKFYSHIILKTRCSNVYSLCYYTSSMYALNWAAYVLKRTSVDIQHGAQGEEHLAYSGFNKVPPSGKYEFLPDVFWCWDDNSANDINSWASGTTIHRAKVWGNPWVDFVNQSEFVPYDLPENYVVYCLQPYGKLLEQNIIAAIKQNSPKYKWFLRLHPRQLSEKYALIKLCQENNISDFVEIENAINVPLPLLLKQCKLHLTRSSGSAIEAALLNKPSVILDPIGIKMYQNLIENGKAVAMDDSLIDIDFLLTKFKG